MRATGINTSPIFTLPGNNLSCNPTLDKLQENPPLEYIGWDKSVSLNSIPPKSGNSCAVKSCHPNDLGNSSKDKEELIRNLFNNFDKDSYGKIIAELMALGYTKEESTEILKRLIEGKERAADWSVNAVKYCGSGVRAILLSFPLAVFKSLVNNFEIDFSPFIKKSIGFFDGLLTGIRNFFQNMIYGGRPDDDRVRNNYEAKRYGNKIPSVWGDIAFHTETKVNPWAFPLLEVLSDKTREIVKPTLFSQNPMWFRVRMGSDINLRFATDFLSFLIHKPLSLFGIKNSKDKVNKINQGEFLSKNYVTKRCAENIGLDSNESFTTKNILSKLFKSFKVLSRVY